MLIPYAYSRILDVKTKSAVISASLILGVVREMRTESVSSLIADSDDQLEYRPMLSKHH